jgi:hypothetical protein
VTGRSAASKRKHFFLKKEAKTFVNEFGSTTRIRLDLLRSG